jgi:2,3-bisphosphoglycerate-dependent phosphoglycerate mutase
VDPPTLILVRHAHALGQEDRAPLSSTGVRDAEALAQVLARESADILVSSPMRRAYQTSQAIAAASGMPVRVDGRLVERTLTAEPREDWLDLLRASFDDTERRFHGGETTAEATRRALWAISDLVRQGFSRPILVTHGNLLTLILRHFRPEVGFSEWQNLTTPDVYRVRPIVSGWAVEHLWGRGA